MMMVQLPAGSSYTRTDAVLHQVESYLSKQADVTDYMTIVGINGDQASANGFIQLKDWSQRKGKGQDAASLAPRYPQWDRFQAVRRECDPAGRFTNDYLDRVLGPVSG